MQCCSCFGLALKRTGLSTLSDAGAGEIHTTTDEFSRYFNNLTLTPINLPSGPDE
jgi:hypothetical protein